MPADPARIVSVTRQFNAPPEVIFDAWLNPEVARKWLFATETGEIIRADIDAQVGGKFSFVDRRVGEDIDHVGEYQEIERPRRLVFTFGVPRYSPVMTRVIVDIAPRAQGCDLTLTHENVLPEYMAQTKDGWTMLLGNLARLVEGKAGSAG